MRLITTAITIFFLFLASACASEVQAQYLKLEQAEPSQQISVGSNFQVKLLINTAGEEAINGDALISFDSNKVSINSAQSGSFFTYFSASPLGGSNTKYLISSWEESVAHAKSSSTDALFATVNLTAKEAGTTVLAFDCVSSNEADSNINRASDSRDIINCASSLPLTINIGGTGPTSTPAPTGSDITPSPTAVASPTSAPSATPTQRPTSTPIPTSPSRPTVTHLPRAGTTEITLFGIATGLILTIIGILAIL